MDGWKWMAGDYRAGGISRPTVSVPLYETGLYPLLRGKDVGIILSANVGWHLIKWNMPTPYFPVIYYRPALSHRNKMWATNVSHTYYLPISSTYVFFIFFPKKVLSNNCACWLSGQPSPIWPNSADKTWKEALLSTCIPEDPREPGRVGWWDEQPVWLGDLAPGFMRVWDWAVMTVRADVPFLRALTTSKCQPRSMNLDSLPRVHALPFEWQTFQPQSWKRPQEAISPVLIFFFNKTSEQR